MDKLAEKLNAVVCQLEQISAETEDDAERRYIQKVLDELLATVQHVQRRSSEDVESTSDRITEAALSAFAEMDFHQVTMRRIAKKAGVALATVYQHFPSKEKLLLSVIQRETEVLVANLKERVRGAANTFDELREHTRGMFQLFEAKPNVVALVYLGLPFEVYLRSGVGRIHARVFDDIIESGLARGDIKSSFDVRMLRYFYFGAFERLVSAWLVRSRSYSLSDMADDFTEIILGGIKK